MVSDVEKGNSNAEREKAEILSWVFTLQLEE